MGKVKVRVPEKIKFNQGSVLVGVLWSLFFLAGLALAINASIVPQLNLAERLRDRVILYYLADAGVQRSIIEIRADETEAYDALNDIWSLNNEEIFKDVPMTENGVYSLENRIPGEGEEDPEKGEKHYGLIDEERKMNINTASIEALTRIFSNIEDVSSQEAEEIAESIADWRDEDDESMDHGAESPYYKSLASGYPCKNARFEVLEELFLVKGMTRKIFDQVKDYLTVYGEGMININTADPTVLRGLDFQDTLIDKIISFREGDDGKLGTEDDHVFTTAQNIPQELSAQLALSPDEINAINAAVNGGFLTVRSDFFSGVSYGRYAGRDISRKIAFVIDREEKIWYWRTN